MKKPENRYIDKIHRQLKKLIPEVWPIRMQMGMGSPRGIPDMLYRGQKRDLWVEYKYIPDWNKKKKLPFGMLTEHQENWMLRAHAMYSPNSHAIIIGDELGNGCWIDPKTYINKTYPNTSVETYILRNPKEMAMFIQQHVHYIENINNESENE